MSEQDPYGDPTRVEPALSDHTQALPATPDGPPPPPPGGTPPPPPGWPGGPAPDRRWWILGGLAALVVLVGLAALILGGGDDTASTSDSSSTTSTTSTTLETTTTSSSSTTTAAPTTTTTAAPTTTTTAPPDTVPPAECASGGPDDPDTSALVLYQAYVLDDRACANQVATGGAVNTLFSIPGGGENWDYQGCTELDEPDPHLDCAFTFPGGATHFRENYSDSKGWTVYEVYQTAD